MGGLHEDTITEPTPGAGLKTLIIGNVSRWQSQGRELQNMADTAYATFSQLDTDLLSETAAQLVLSPLVFGGQDAMDVAARLSELSYIGLYRIVSLPLEDPEMVKRELDAVAPDLNVDVLIVGDA